MREIKIEELYKVYNPLEIKQKPAIAVATSEKGTNGLTIGWGSIGVLWSRPMFTVYIHKDRYSKQIFDEAKYFAVCFFDSEYKDELNYFGTASGRNEDKIAISKLTCNKDDLAPYFEESRLVIICKMSGISDFDVNHVAESVTPWYKKSGVHTIYNGEIVKVLVK